MIGRKLYLSDKDRKIAGVCGGLAEYFGIDSTIVRILWALAVLVSYGTGFILYLVFWLIVPRERNILP
ncbi:PspC domain-containing protein [uncultured Prevotella sp.]|jgi:phage shock protein C|uniref:PspC domain-containing protein n=1 Tax=uncultured Prevotella sp. TaxID=159272 RepID=UPI002676CD2B|nr:PspC domain-containing protein [uncultured Prevotella sp.]